MTSAELVGLIGQNRYLKGTEIQLSKEDIYIAATQAQMEIMRDGRILEREGKLALALDQDEYYFEELAVEDATNATPIVITITDHTYHTGDLVTIFGVLGNTAANGRRAVTKITDDTFSIDGSVGNAAYTSGGKTYHDLIAAFEILRLRRNESPFDIIPIDGEEEIELERGSFNGIGNDTTGYKGVIRAYQTYEANLRLIFVAKPQGDIQMKFRYIRIPLPSEDISGTVNPIIPRYYDNVLLKGTMYHILDNANNEAASNQALTTIKEYEYQLDKLRKANSRRHYRHEVQIPTMDW